MRGEPRTIYSKTKIIRRTGKIPVVAAKVAGLNPNRMVLRFASPDGAGILISPHPDFTADVVGEPVETGKSVVLTFGADGPLTQCEWFAISTVPNLRLHVIEVITDCEGGGSAVDSALLPIV